MLSFSENRGKYHLVNYKRAKFKKFPNSRIATYPRSELLGWPESLRPCWWLWSSIRSRAGKRCLRLDKSSRTIDHSWWHLGWWWSPWCWEWSDTCRRPSCGCTESPSCWSPCDEENYDTEYITMSRMKPGHNTRRCQKGKCNWIWELPCIGSPAGSCSSPESENEVFSSKSNHKKQLMWFCCWQYPDNDPILPLWSLKRLSTTRLPWLAWLPSWIPINHPHCIHRNKNPQLMVYTNCINFENIEN